MEKEELRHLGYIDKMLLNRMNEYAKEFEAKILMLTGIALKGLGIEIETFDTKRLSRGIQGDITQIYLDKNMLIVQVKQEIRHLVDRQDVLKCYWPEK